MGFHFPALARTSRIVAFAAENREQIFDFIFIDAIKKWRHGQKKSIHANLYSVAKATYLLLTFYYNQGGKLK